jgi:HEAT repeat protein
MRASFLAAALGAALALLPLGAGAENTAIPLRADAVKRLKSGDAAQIKSALDEVRMSAKAGATAVPAIVELLKNGLSVPLTQAALETLGDTESPGASEVLAWYSRHRNAELRRAAVQALAKTRGPVATKALRAALSDLDPAIRAVSATGLGSMKAKEAVGDLFVALEHKVEEAAASIGQLCMGNECERLAGKLGSVPFDVVTGGLDEVMLRPAADVSDDLKLKIVGRVREVGTAEAHRFLKSVQGKWPARWSPRVKQAIDQAALATSGSPGSGEVAP